jgi:hypothetical protein
VKIGPDGAFEVTMLGGATRSSFNNQPYLFTAEAAGDHGEWISQEFYVTATTVALPALKLWDDVAPTVAADTGDLQVKWTPPAGAKLTDATLVVSQDLQDIWSVKLADPSKGGTYTVPGAVLDDNKVCNVKVKLRGSPTAYDSANHDFNTGAVGREKVLAIAAVTADDGGPHTRLTDGIKGPLDLIDLASPGPGQPPSKEGGTLNVVLDLGTSQAIAKLAFYNTPSDKPNLTISVADTPDGKGAKTWQGGTSSTLVDLGGAKGRYIRLSGAAGNINDIAEVRVIGS